MTVLLIFSGFVALACMVALTDWRRAWLLAIVIGVLQDPARKLTAGTPVFMTFAIVGVYIAILFGTQHQLQAALRDFSRRFPQIWLAFGVLLLFLILGAINGIITFGLSLWKAPLLALFVYLAPLPAVLLGYLYLDREERLYRLLTFYAIVTSIALIGSPLEYYRVPVPALGMVQQVGDYIRFLPGMELRMISGFYRAPDVMGWHAATLTSIAVGMVVRAQMSRRSWPWMLAVAWGFYNCLISGRRKAVYYVLIFLIVFVWRYFRNLKTPQVAALAMTGLAIAFVVSRISADEQSRVYARGTVTTQEELSQRLEGGLFETIRQTGITGAGLGVATQGVQHLLGPEQSLSWQEGGLGKLAVELGLPGLLAAMLLGWRMLRMMMRITAAPDHPATSRVGRAMLFGLVVANLANFTASAQTYSDPVLTIFLCFLVGTLFATITLDERVDAAQAAAPSQPLVYAPQA